MAMRIYGENLISEEFVSHIWNSGHFAKDAIRAKDGRKIEVIYQGRWNDDSGADFRDAEIKIDGQISKGDVEVHVRGSHWRLHHHHINPRYNGTILHVVMWDDGINLLTRKQNGERIPTLVLCDYLNSPIGGLWKTINTAEEPSPCQLRAKSMTQEALGKILDRAGMDRFSGKTRLYEEHPEESSGDQLLYEGTMEALGYSKNKKPFLKLARTVPLELLAGRSAEETQAIFLNVAGLIPSKAYDGEIFDEETEEYLRRLERLWEPFSSRLGDKCMSEEEWEFTIRPENFPTRRIAGMSHILTRCRNETESGAGPLTEMFLSVFEGSKTARKLRDMLMQPASGYWSNHYTFGGRQRRENHLLIGQNRASDITINVILPALCAYARQCQNEGLEQKTIRLYTDHRKLQENRITRYFDGRVFRDKKHQDSLVNSAMRQQGLIHIYKTFCALGNCRDCSIMEQNI